jgi:hypothetical protein
VTVAIPSIDEYTWSVCRKNQKRPPASQPGVRMVVLRLLDQNGRPMAGAKAVLKMIRAGEIVTSTDVPVGSTGIVQLCDITEPATDMIVFVERDGLPPFERAERLTGALTAATVVVRR